MNKEIKKAMPGMIAGAAFGLLMLLSFNIGIKYQENKRDHVEEILNEIVTDQDRVIDSLKTALQTSNEKRGRLFLALLYTDIKGKEAALDSLIIEIGKDN